MVGVAPAVDASRVPSIVKVLPLPSAVTPPVVCIDSVPSSRTVSPPLKVAVDDPTVSVPPLTYATLVASPVAAPKV